MLLFALLFVAGWVLVVYEHRAKRKAAARRYVRRMR
jgi:hypothetical protein